MISAFRSISDLRRWIDSSGAPSETPQSARMSCPEKIFGMSLRADWKEKESSNSGAGMLVVLRIRTGNMLFLEGHVEGKLVLEGARRSRWSGQQPAASSKQRGRRSARLLKFKRPLSHVSEYMGYGIWDTSPTRGPFSMGR